ncbi:MAG: hypothetical protein ABIW82_09660 [Dokdonella sp.]
MVKATGNATGNEKPSKDDRKAEVRQIILAQGNDFIKELLRAHGLKIGANKKDFEINLTAAIESDALTQEMIDAWLAEIEGWGNQHLYLFAAPTIAESKLKAQLQASKYAALSGLKQSYAFPDRLTLTSIALDGDHLSLVWHLGKEGWNRAKDKDRTEEVELERYRYEAYRQRRDRSTVRFEWRFADHYCAILIHRNKEIDHADAMQEIWRVLAALGIAEKPLATVPLNNAVKSASNGKSSTKSARFEAEGGFVELGSTLAQGGIESVEAVRQARLAVNDNAFAKAQGIFNFTIEEHKDLNRSIAVQIYGTEGRLRFWAQCPRDDVYRVLNFLQQHN